MKKVISILCTLSLLLVFSSCGVKQKPDAMVAKFCDSLKNFDVKTMTTYIADNDGDLSNMEQDELNADIYTVLKEKAAEITYEIGETVINEDTAEVTVKFTYSDVSNAVPLAAGEYLSQALGLALTGADEETLVKLFEGILVEKIRSITPATAESTIQISCVMTEEGWKIKELPDEFINVMTSNILKGLEGFNDNSFDFGEIFD